MQATHYLSIMLLDHQLDKYNQIMIIIVSIRQQSIQPRHTWTWQIVINTWRDTCHCCCHAICPTLSNNVAYLRIIVANIRHYTNRSLAFDLLWRGCEIIVGQFVMLSWFIIVASQKYEWRIAGDGSWKCWIYFPSINSLKNKDINSMEVTKGEYFCRSIATCH